MKRRIFAFTLFIALIASLLSSCSFALPPQKQVREYFGYFDTFSSLSIYTSDKALFESAADELDTLLEDYNKLFDIYHSYDGITNLRDINESAGKGAMKVDGRLLDALEFGKQMHAVTNGYTNIALGSVISLWHEAREYSKKNPDSAYIPDEADIRDALLHTDIDSLVLDNDALTVEITDEKLSLDLGAIAKGYVAERAAELLIDLGITDFLINLGGNVLSCGRKTDGSDWSAVVEDPFDSSKDGYGSPIAISDRTLVTSGSYHRYYTVGNKNYSHIISKDDGMPPEHFVSVSVICPYSQSGLADALSTALFCMPLEDGRALVESLNGVSALWIFPDGSSAHADGSGGVE